RNDVALAHVLDEARALFQAGEYQIEDMVCLFTMLGDVRKGGAALFQAGELVLVGLPNVSSPLLDLISYLELCVEVGGVELTREVARADVDPGVLNDLAPEEARAVGAFLPQEFCSFGEAWIIDDEGAAFATGEVLGVVETL